MDAIKTYQEITGACTVYSKRIIFGLLLIFQKDLILSRKIESWELLSLKHAITRRY